MKPACKACPVVLRGRNGNLEVLAFVHPTAGKQFVKGTVAAGERPHDAAVRELREESGLRATGPLTPLGRLDIGAARTVWHFFLYRSSGLPETWSHRTEDDFGHTFAFFWHPLASPLDRDWHPDFHAAFGFFAPRCRAR